MNDNLQVMNVCDEFFKDNGGFLSDSTSTTLDACDNDVMDLRYAQRAKSGILLHEMTHTSYGVNKESGYVAPLSKPPLTIPVGPC